MVRISEAWLTQDCWVGMGFGSGAGGGGFFNMFSH